MQLNPISTLYHIAPCCLVFLSIPCAYIEVRILVLTREFSQGRPETLFGKFTQYGVKSFAVGYILSRDAENRGKRGRIGKKEDDRKNRGNREMHGEACVTKSFEEAKLRCGYA